ncbi:MAG: hypothetical protein R6U89_05610 [Dehalococcoidia bacterium]
MILKPQDIYILLKLIAMKDRDWSYSTLASELYMSPSEVHGGIKRAKKAKLYFPNKKKPVKKSLEEFLIHGVKYAYPAERGALTRGIPTSYAAPPLNKIISQADEEPPVWPDPDGHTLGFEFPPLFKSVPKAIAIDPDLYELLALVDAIRGGRAREREIAERELKSRLNAKW